MGLRLPRPAPFWGVQWRNACRLDGVTSHVMWSAGRPLLFDTRTEARDYINKHFGYIRGRADLRKEPHGWRVPKPVRVNVLVTPT